MAGGIGAQGLPLGNSSSLFQSTLTCYISIQFSCEALDNHLFAFKPAKSKLLDARRQLLSIGLFLELKVSSMRMTVEISCLNLAVPVASVQV